VGGRDGVLNLSLIESALGRPYSGYHPEIWQKAAALVQSMAGNHGFIDGNKRTTLILLHTLVTNSGYELVPLCNEDRDQIVEDVILSVASGSASFEELADWFNLRIHQIPPG
jgi:death on curing protein